MWASIDETSRDSIEQMPVERIEQPVAARSELKSSAVELEVIQCGKAGCKCKATSSRWKGKSSDTSSDWVVLKSFPVEQKITDSPEKALDNAISAAQDWIQDEKPSRFRHRESAKNRSNNGTVFTRYYDCMYLHKADCNCKMRIFHSYGSMDVTVQWWILGSAHGIPLSHDGGFSTYELHQDFSHIRVDPSKGLPLEMEEHIDDTMANHHDLSFARLKENLRSYRSNGKLVWDVSKEQWSEWNSKIKSRRNTAINSNNSRASQNLVDSLRDIQAYASEHTYEKMKDREGFSNDDMFVCGYDIKVESSLPPADREQRKEWKPKHVCRVAITSITMSMFIPVLSSRGDIFPRICLASDMTYKVFIIQAFRLMEISVYDAAGDAKVVGYLITCNENGGDFAFGARAFTNVTEHLCSLSKADLPVEYLPFNLPSPVPPCNRNHPFTHKEDPAKPRSFTVEQTASGFVAFRSSRHASVKSENARSKITSQAVYSPPLVPSVQEGDSVESFRCDTFGLEIHSASDGDPSIPNGLGGGVPAMSHNHADCWAHKHINLDETIKGKGRNADKAPEFDLSEFDAIEDTKERKRQVSAAKQKFRNFAVDAVKDVKFCTSRGISSLLYEDFLCQLREGRTAGVKGNFTKFAGYIATSFARRTNLGSNGVWRYSDLLDVDLKNYDEATGDLNNSIAKPGSLVFGLPDNTNSVENRHLNFKEFNERRRSTVTKAMDSLFEYGHNYSRDEVIDYGVSFLPVVYGNGRVESTHFAEDVRLGMQFLGYEDTLLHMDQKLLVFKTGSGMSAKVYMLRGSVELEYLQRQVDGDDGVEPIPRDGFETKRDQAQAWLNRHRAVSAASLETLEAMVANGAKEFFVGMSDGLFASEEDVPADASETHPELWARARTIAINELHEFERCFVLLTPIDANFDGVQCFEPFRSKPPYDKNVVYKWRCTCDRGLKYGFCGHIFFMAHGSHGLEGYCEEDIPASAVTSNYGQKRTAGRPPNSGGPLEKMRRDC